jgi:hypothetical protein
MESNGGTLGRASIATCVFPRTTRRLRRGLPCWCGES